jgi:hypothetical protein
MFGLCFNFLCKQMETSKERIEKFLAHSKKSKNAAGVLIGDKNGMRFTHVLNGRNEISEKFASDIVSKFPEIRYGWLLNGEGDMVDLSKLNESENIEQFIVKDSFEQFVVTNKNGNEISNMPDGSFLMRVPLVPVKAYARYISEGDSAQFLENAEFVFFRVDHVAKGKYLAFVIKGDSFWNEGGYDTPDKAIVLVRELQRTHWKDGFRESELGWIIVTHHNVVIKDIINQDLINGIITCHSRNPSPEYSDFTLSLDEDVKSIWKVIKRQF